MPRFLRTFLLAALALAGAVLAQDSSFPPSGSPQGTPFDHRAPTNQRIGRIVVHSGTFVDGLRLRYENRGGTLTTDSPQIGNTTGTPSTFVVPAHDWLNRVEVWYDASTGYLRGITFQTHYGHRVEFGTQIGTLVTFVSVNNTEIVGLLGTASALMNSVGVTTRPVLGSHTVYGTGCDSGSGVMQIRWRANGSGRLAVGGSGIVESTNVVGSVGVISVGFGAPIDVPLGFLGAPGCSLYTPADFLLFGGTDPGNILGWLILVPNDPNLVGARLDAQFASVNAPNALGIATSGVMRAQVGVL